MISDSLRNRIIDWPSLPPIAKQFMLDGGFMPKWSQFSHEDVVQLEKLGIINGCGGKGGRVKPPQFRFRASCNQHDWNYYLGGSQADRAKADRQFYIAMLGDVRKLPLWRWPVHLTAAFLYYAAVRRHGMRFFDEWEV